MTVKRSCLRMLRVSPLWLWGLILLVQCTIPPADTAPPTATRETVVTSTPTLVGYSVNTTAKIRSGPGFDYDVVGNKAPGDTVEPIARSADGQWLQLGEGQWIFFSSVKGTTRSLPIVPTPPEAPTVSETEPDTVDAEIPESYFERPLIPGAVYAATPEWKAVAAALVEERRAPILEDDPDPPYTFARVLLHTDVYGCDRGFERCDLRPGAYPGTWIVLLHETVQPDGYRICYTGEFSGNEGQLRRTGWALYPCSALTYPVDNPLSDTFRASVEAYVTQGYAPSPTAVSGWEELLTVRSMYRSWAYNCHSQGCLWVQMIDNVDYDLLGVDTLPDGTDICLLQSKAVGWWLLPCEALVMHEGNIGRAVDSAVGLAVGARVMGRSINALHCPPGHGPLEADWDNCDHGLLEWTLDYDITGIVWSGSEWFCGLATADTDKIYVVLCSNLGHPIGY